MAFDPIIPATIGFLILAGIIVWRYCVFVVRRGSERASNATSSTTHVPEAPREPVDPPGRLDEPFEEEDFEDDSSSSRAAWMWDYPTEHDSSNSSSESGPPHDYDFDALQLNSSTNLSTVGIDYAEVLAERGIELDSSEWAGQQIIGPDPNIQQMVAGHQIAGINLPNTTKAAWSAEDLFVQQADMRTHDNGLQQVLNALHRAVGTWAGCEDVSLRDYRFVINFARMATADHKQFVVKMKSPIEQKLTLTLRMDPGSMQVIWVCWYDGQEFSVPQRTLPEVEIQAYPPIGPGAREERVIEFRDD